MRTQRVSVAGGCLYAMNTFISSTKIQYNHP